MIKLVFCARRKPGLSKEEFQRYWLEEHGPLVRSLREQIPSMRRYVQSHTVWGPATDAVQASRGSAEPYDGITEVWFDDLAAIGGTGTDAAAAAGKRLYDDESTFIDFAGSNLFITVEHEIF
jgi:uncharacterized protein (TIGR02118 family)